MSASFSLAEPEKFSSQLEKFLKKLWKPLQAQPCAAALTVRPYLCGGKSLNNIPSGAPDGHRDVIYFRQKAYREHSIHENIRYSTQPRGARPAAHQACIQ